MPKVNIPRSTGTSARSRGRALFTNTQLGSVGGAITQLGSVLTEETINAIKRRDKVVETDYITNALIDTSEESARLQKSMLESRPDIKGFADDFIKDYDKLIKGKIDNAPTANAKRVLKNTFTSTRIDNFKRTFDIENKGIADNILAKSQANIELISERVFEDPASFKAALERIPLIKENVGQVLDQANTDKFIKEAELSIANGFMRGLIDRDVEEAEKALKSEGIRGILGFEQVNEYEKAIEGQKKVIENQIKIERKAVFDKTNNKFIAQEQTNKLAIEDILNSELPAVGIGSKDFWLRRLSHTEVNDPGSALEFSKAYVDIENLSEEEIFNLADPLKLEEGKRPINMKQVQQLLEIRRKDVDLIANKFSKAIKGDVTGSNSFAGFSDPKGDINFYEMSIEVHDKITELQKEGKDVKAAFTPGSGSYAEVGGTIHAKYKRTQAEIMASISEEFKSSKDRVITRLEKAGLSSEQIEQELINRGIN